MMKDRHKRIWRNSDGAVAATYALALVPIIAMAGLAWDYTRLVGMDTELQNAADQAALAGASQLDRTTGSMQRAANAIQNGLVSNSTLLSNDGDGLTVAITDAEVQITFYETRADAEAGTGGFALSTAAANDARAGFVQVTVDTRSAEYAFTPVVGAFVGDISAAAVAGLGSALCRVPPLMICNPDEPSGATTMNVAGRIGHGLLAKPGGGGQWVPGNYGYLDVGLANGAVGVRQALGWGSAGNCIAQNGPATVDTQTGNIANAPGAANTRFDVYENQACETGGDCPSAINVRKDMVRPQGSAPGSGATCQVNNNQGGWRLPHQGSNPNFLGDAYLPTDATVTYTHTPKSMGHPRDICHAVYEGAPGACWDTTINGNFGDGEWDRNAYFRSNYLRTEVGTRGPANTPWDEDDWQFHLASALTDTDGDGTPDHPIAELTRYEVYKWEEENSGDLVDGVYVLDPVTYVDGGTGSNVEHHGQSICSAQHGYTPIATPDRRKMSVAVVNCTAEGVSGNSTGVNVVQWIDVFLVQVAADRQYNGRHWTGKDELYVELIGENTTRSTGSTDGITIRRDVPFLVK